MTLEEKLNRSLSKQNITLVIIFYISFLISYSLAFNTMLFNVDSLSRIEGYTAIGGANVGRIFRNLIGNGLTNNSYNIQITTFLFTTFLIISIFLLYRLFNINSLIYKLLLLEAVITFPLFGIFYAYGNDVFLHSFCLMISVIAVLCLFTGNRKHYVISIALIILMLGIYQMFLSVVTGLIIAKIMIDIIEFKQIKLNEVLEKLVILVIAVLVYYLLLQLIFGFGVVEPSSYKTMDKIGIFSIFSFIPHYILMSYYYFIQLLLENLQLLNGSFIISITYVTAMIGFLFAGLKVIRLPYSKNNKLLFVLSFLVFPLAITSANLAVLGFEQYNQYGVLILLLTGIGLFSKTGLRYNPLIIFLISIAIFSNFQLLSNYLLIDSMNTNQVLDIEYNIIYDILSNDDIDSNSLIAFCGEPYRNQNEVLFADNGIYSKYSLQTNAGSSLLHFQRPAKQQQFTNLLGYKFNINSYDCSNQTNTQPVYPQPGYIEQVDNRQFVVNLGPIDNN